VLTPYTGARERQPGEVPLELISSGQLRYNFDNSIDFLGAALYQGDPLYAQVNAPADSVIKIYRMEGNEFMAVVCVVLLPSIHACILTNADMVRCAIVYSLVLFP
jgi:hypothetical protein